jgi:hypothetical protein
VINNPKEHMSSLLIGVNKPISNIEFDVEADLHTTLLHWYRLAVLLADLPAFQGVSFYRIAELVKTNTPTKRLSPIQFADGQKGYQLTSGENYTLRILQSIPSLSTNVKLPFTMELHANDKHIVPMRKAELVDGIYDSLLFYFQVQPQDKQKTKSFTILESMQKLKFADNLGAWPPGTFNEEVSVPANFIPVNITWPWWIVLWRWFFPPLAAILAIFLWFGAAWLIKSAAFFTTFGITKEILRYIAIFLLAFAFQNWSSFTGQFKVSSLST